VVYLESQTCKRARIGEGAGRLWLASPLIRALGMTDKHAVRAAPKPIAGSGTKSRRTAKSVRRIRARPAGEPRLNVGRWSLVSAPEDVGFCRWSVKRATSAYKNARRSD